MSGKTARRLRRLTEQAMNAPQGSTTAAHNNGNYKEHPVMRKEKPSNQNKPVMTTTIRLERKDPRAFYQEAKRMYKTGEALAEANRIQKEYREEQKKAAKGIADKIAEIVEAPPSPNFPMQAKNIDPVVWLDGFAQWLIQGEEPLGGVLPFQIVTSLSSVDAGYLTVTGLDSVSQKGLMFVISSAGYIRCYDGEVIQLLDENDDCADVYEQLVALLMADLRETDQITNMEIIDAQ